uniref:Bromo domain-containing protein n=1 Tax=Schistocephalus solidus TaxID=70667 RepID=A0A0V0J341_SCHSO
MVLSRRHWKTRASLPRFLPANLQQSPPPNSTSPTKSPPLTSSPPSDWRPRRPGRPPKRRHFKSLPVSRPQEGTPESKVISAAQQENTVLLQSPSIELSQCSQEPARVATPSTSPPSLPDFTQTRSRTASVPPPPSLSKAEDLSAVDEDEDNDEVENGDSSESQDSSQHGYGRVRRLKRKLVRKRSRSVRMAAHMRRITRSSVAPARRLIRALQSHDDATDEAGAESEHPKNDLDRNDAAVVYSLRPRRVSVPSPQSASPPRLRKRVRLEEPSYSSNGTKREDEEGDEDDDNAGQRRYPMRNRRHTDVYQVECHPHGHPRDWFAGTGYKERRRSRRCRRRRRRRDSRSIWPRAHDTSSTSSSCSSDSSSYGENGGHGLHKGCFTPAVSNAGLVDMDELRFERRRSKSLLHSRSELMPINIKPKDLESGPLRDRLVAGTTLTDIEPMTMDTNITFEDVGGLQAQIRSLQESVLLPLVYPEVFEGFGIEPPRGVLFYGPPGTGKTLLARALANECTRMASAGTGPTHLTSAGQTARPVAFFMRKGADCLSKWVGESERQLRLLFDQAYRMRPSIIFFDEIDGLAPVRSSRQDQIHSSIVSTLLSLMDGLDRRAEVVVIGATNRPDAIDPALRRPGRFDREFAFSLPNEPVRRRILEIHTAKWKPPPSAELLRELARLTVGYCGADLKGLATEACLCCLRRQYPQVYQSKLKLKLDTSYLVVDRSDWLIALRHIRPASLRAELDVGSAASPASVALASTSRRALPSARTDCGGARGDVPQGPLQVLLAPLVDQLAIRITRALLGRNIPPPTPPLLSPERPPQAATPRSATADLDSTGRSEKVVWRQAPEACNYDEEREAAGDGCGQHICEDDAVCPRTHSALLSTLSLATSPVLIKQLLVDDSLHPSVFPAVWRRLESVEVFTINLASLFAASASGDSCVVTSISQILGAAQRALANQREVDPTEMVDGDSSHGHCGVANTTLGVVLFIPRIDRLFNRLPNLAAFYLIDRLIELTATSSGSQVVCDFGGSSPTGRRLVLVATFRWPRNPPASDTVLNSVSKTSPLTIRLPQSALSPRSHPQPSESVVCNGHASPRVIARIRQQQQTAEVPSPGSRFRKPPALKSAPLPPPPSDWLCPALEASTQPISTPSALSPLAASHRCLPTFMRPLHRTGVNFRPPPFSSTATTEGALDEEPESPRRSGNAADASAAYMRCLFRFPYLELISFEPPQDYQRSLYFRPLFFDWLEPTLRESTDEKRTDQRRPPTPQPICSASNSASVDALANRSLSQAEIAELRRQHETLQRQLRVVMRRVVAQLARDRRFTVFTRPVQADEAPDYFEVISTPMDLGVVRDKIDAREYSTVESFKADLKLIYSNALEYNPPNVPRSREIRARAFEFWDAIEIILAEELNPPDLEDMCAAAAKACELHASQQQQHTPETSAGNTCKSAAVVAPNKPPPLPLPLGPRYSRRLHGEQPILDDDDVYQLLNPRQRHMSPTKPVRPTSPAVVSDSALRPNPAEENIEASEEAVSVEHTALPPSKATEVAPSQQKTVSCVRSRRVSHSTDHEVSGLLGTNSGTTAGVDVVAAAAMAAMQSQLEKTCLATRGWSVDQLISLHCDLFHVLADIHPTSNLDLPGLVTRLSKVLSRHQEIVSRTTYDDFEISPVPCSSPPLLQ